MRKLTLGAIALAASTMMGSTASHATFMIQGWTDTGSAARMAAVAAASLNATIGQTQTGGLLFGIAPDITAATNRSITSPRPALRLALFSRTAARRAAAPPVSPACRTPTGFSPALMRWYQQALFRQ